MQNVPQATAMVLEIQRAGKIMLEQMANANGLVGKYQLGEGRKFIHAHFVTPNEAGEFVAREDLPVTEDQIDAAMQAMASIAVVLNANARVFLDIAM